MEYEKRDWHLQIGQSGIFSKQVLRININNDKQSTSILTHTLNLTFLYVTVSTLNPTVGIVVTD